MPFDESWCGFKANPVYPSLPPINLIGDVCNRMPYLEVIELSILHCPDEHTSAHR